MRKPKSYNRVGILIKLFIMRKLEDFNCEKIELDSIYGGRLLRAKTL